MSKLIDKLNRMQTVSPPMGFGRTQAAAQKPRLLVIASLGAASPENIPGADAALINDAKAAASAKETGRDASDVPCGTWLKASEKVDSEGLVKSGIDFVVFGTDHSVDISKELGKVLEVGPDTKEGLLAAVNNLPVDAVLINLNLGKASLTWRDVMVLRLFSDILSRPALALLPANLTKTDLKAVWQAGIDGIVVEGNVKELRETIDGMEFPLSRQRNKSGTALLPRVEPMGEPEEEEEEGE